MKIACLFPGLGYTCDRPLLHYSRKLLSSLGWEILPVSYGGFPEGIKDNAEKLKQCAEIALAQAEEQLKEIEWNRCESVLFVSKSIGTVAAGAYAAKHRISCRHILFTPVEATFLFGTKKAIAFHGTADPWADTDKITNACQAAGIPLYLTEGANHSLETGDVEADLEIMKKVMRTVREYAGRDH